MRVISLLLAPLVPLIKAVNESLPLWAFETRFTLRKRNLWIIAGFIIISLVCVKAGIDEYRQAEHDRIRALDNESARTAAVLDGKTNVASRARVFLAPNFISILTGAPPINQRAFAVIDAGGVTDIRASLLSGSAFTSHTPGIISFAGIVYYAGSLLFLFLAYDGYRNRDFLRFHYSIQSQRAVFVVIYFSRFLLAAAIFILNVLLACLVISAHGIPVFHGGNFGTVLVFTAYSGLYLWWFYTLGVVITNIRMKWSRASFIAVAWVILVFVVPGLIGHYIAGKANRMTSVHQLEAQQLHTPAAGEEKPAPAAALPLTGKLLDNYDRLVDNYLNISQLFPTAWYLTGNTELGGAGVTGTVDLFRFALGRKRIFSHSSPGAPGTRPHGSTVAGLDKNVFRSGGEKRGKIFPGDWILSSGIFLMTLISIMVHLHSVPGGFRRFRADSKDITLPVSMHKKTMIIAPEEFGIMVYNTINCQGFGFDGSFQERGFQGWGAVYIPHPSKLPPNINVNWLVKLVKRTVNSDMIRGDFNKNVLDELQPLFKYPLHQLTQNEKILLLLTLAEQCLPGVLIMDDTLKDANPRGIEKISAKMNSIAERKSIIYFNSQPAYTPPVQFDNTALVIENEGKYKLEKFD